MPGKGTRRKKLSKHKSAKGFCFSCGASKSSRFRPAPLKWEAFYAFYDDERNGKKTKICASCHLKLSKSCKLPTIEHASSLMNNDQGATKQISVLVKPSPISGNGEYLLGSSHSNISHLLINGSLQKKRPFCTTRFCQRRSCY